MDICEFKCNSNKACLDLSQICDGKSDCDDGQDEVMQFWRIYISSQFNKKIYFLKEKLHLFKDGQLHRT